MVETTSTLSPFLFDDLDTSMLDKEVASHSSQLVDSPRVSSTPPSTPGLDTPLEVNDEDDDEDDDDEDNHDYGYDQYINDEETDMGEDFFFKDFATGRDNTSNGTNSNTAKRMSRRRRSQKVMSKFDLQSFARQLHENRLSVLQTRQSRMILTEDDERELEKLLARKQSYDPPPPVPSLPSTEEPPPQPSSAAETATTSLTTQEEAKATIIEPTPSFHMAGPSTPPPLTKPSVLLQKLNNHPSSRSKDPLLNEICPLSPSLSDPSSFISPRRAPTPPSAASSSTSSTASSANTSSSFFSTINNNNNATLAALAPATAATSTPIVTVKKKASWMTSRKQGKRQQQQQQQQQQSSSPLKSDHQPRRSMSMDTLRQQANMPTIAVKPLEDKKPRLGLFGSLRQASRSSRASSTGGTIRGLMRNLSTVGQRPSQQHQQSQRHPADQDSPQENSSMSRAAMAVIHHGVPTKKEKHTPPLAPEVLDPTMTEGVDDTTVHVTHTATSAKVGVRLLSNLLAKAKSRRSTTKTTNMEQQQQQQQQRPSEDNDGSNDRQATKERNKVVRRTIIYVQPDALDFMKDGHMPPIPAPKNRQRVSDGINASDNDRFSKDTIMDDTASSTVEYARATKLTRQTSRRKRLVEEPASSSEPVHRSNSKNEKKWRLESVTEFDGDKKKHDNDNGGDNDEVDGLFDYYRTRNESNTCLEGLELREMSDGSVVWGIVKKQGNRKSFFASKALENRIMEHLHQQNDDGVDDDVEKEHEEIEKSVLALMGLEPDSLDHLPAKLSPTTSASPLRTSGNVLTARALTPPPIPKRSPRRKMQDHATEISPEERRLQRGLSVEEQLDEMMLSIKLSQQ